jgi:hypothetical protein
MTLRQFIAMWNEKYGDTIIPERVHCLRKGCGKSGDELIVPDTICGTVKCPAHDEYWIATPRSKYATLD